MSHFIQHSPEALEVVIPSAQFESSAADSFCYQLAGAISHDPDAVKASSLSIDLSRVESIDSVGATALASLSRHSGSNATISLINPQPSVRSVLQLLRLDRLIALEG